MLLRLAPFLFVFLWSTGWISARAAAPYADPILFLVIRFGLAAVALLAISLAMGATWPARRRDAGHAMMSGFLIHAAYLGPVWWAVAHGVPTAISGLIAALQPILTALLAPRLVGETISVRQWLGIGLGFVGIAVVLSPKLAGLGALALGDFALPLAVNVVGMIAVTLGTFYQKRFIPTGDLRTVATLQYVAASASLVPFALLLEPLRFEWNWQSGLTMAWSVLALSIGAVGLLLMLIRQGAVSRAATLIYLVPPAVAIEAFILFGETLAPVQIAGMALTALGVALAVRRG